MYWNSTLLHNIQIVFEIVSPAQLLLRRQLFTLPKKLTCTKMWKIWEIIFVITLLSNDLSLDAQSRRGCSPHTYICDRFGSLLKFFVIVLCGNCHCSSINVILHVSFRHEFIYNEIRNEMPYFHFIPPSLKTCLPSFAAKMCYFFLH